MSLRRLVLYTPIAAVLSQLAAAAAMVALVGIWWCTYRMVSAYHPPPVQWRWAVLSGLGWYQRWGLACSPVRIGLCAVAIMPLTFALLAGTLRSKRVGPRHVWRIWAYGASILPLVLAVPILFPLLSTIAWTIVSSVPMTYDEQKVWAIRFSLIGGTACWKVGFGALCLWLIAWWSWATGHYLRLPRPWLIGTLMSTISVLAATLLVLVLSNKLWFFEKF